MEYKELKHLLLSKKTLTIEEAEKIICLWSETPGTYSNFMRNKNASIMLQVYNGVSDENNPKHEFEPIKVLVPSAPVAEKFFQLENEKITESFLTVITQLSKEKEQIIETCAFPYMEERCMKHLNVETIKKIIRGWNYLFDFTTDKDGNLFNMLYQKLPEPFWQELFSVNSVNVFGWANYLLEHKDRHEFIRRLIMASHYMGPYFNLEAFGRKYYINYMLDINKSVRETIEQMS